MHLLASSNNLFNSKNVKKLTFDTIVFETIAEEEGQYDVSVLFDTNNQMLSQNFTFSSTLAAQVIDVMPRVVSSANTKINIDGSRFATDDISKFDVTIGDQQCQVSSFTEENIVCILQGLDLGKNFVNINIKSKLKVLHRIQLLQ